MYLKKTVCLRNVKTFESMQRKPYGRVKSDDSDLPQFEQPSCRK